MMAAMQARQEPDPTILIARWVVPVSQPPIPDGAVCTRAGRILWVGPRDAVPGELRPAGTEVLDLGDAAVLPGLVNVHTHVELTALRGYCESLDFFAWIRALTDVKYKFLAASDFLASARWGALEALRGGVTTVADASDSCQVVRALADTGLNGVVYQEVFGPDGRQASDQVRRLAAVIQEQEQLTQGSRLRLGISPHAPYTVSAPLFREAIELAAAMGLPVAIHAAESQAEAAFVREGSGPFAEHLRQRGIAVEKIGTSTVRYLEELGVLAAKPLLVHCVDVDSTDLELIARAGAAIAHCPKSNLKLGHGVAPLVESLARGIRVGIGTDGAVSNNGCDLLEEARFAMFLQRGWRDPRAGGAAAPGAREIVRLLTLGGAEALGLQAEIGSIEPGKWADLVAIRLDVPGTIPAYDPETAIVCSSSACHNLLTMVGGRILFRDGKFPTIDEAKLRQDLAQTTRKLRGSQPQSRSLGQEASSLPRG
jgi:5-methylthioadenosine/S-adenosylhomocysteine deaminase